MNKYEQWKSQQQTKCTIESTPGLFEGGVAVVRPAFGMLETYADNYLAGYGIVTPHQSTVFPWRLTCPISGYSQVFRTSELDPI